MNTLPLFPLNVVLFPGGFLPLRIFEARYLDMITRCIKFQTHFGVVTVHANKQQTEQSPFHFEMVGTSAKVMAVDVPQTNLMMIRCEGVQRFRVKSAYQEEDGLWVGDIDWIAPDQSLTVPDDLIDVSNYLQQVIHAFSDSDMSDEQIPIQKPYHFDDCSWVANRWCELLNIGLQEQQRLLELDSPLIRLELAYDILLENKPDD